MRGKTKLYVYLEPSCLYLHARSVEHERDFSYFYGLLHDLSEGMRNLSLVCGCGVWRACRVHALCVNVYVVKLPDGKNLKITNTYRIRNSQNNEYSENLFHHNEYNEFSLPHPDR